MKPETEFKRQTTKHKPRASFRKDQPLLFRKKLANHNRAIIWLHKDRHAEIEQLADLTGLTMTTVADTLIRYAIMQCQIIDDAGTDQGLREYLDSLIGAQLTGHNTDVEIDTVGDPAAVDEIQHVAAYGTGASGPIAGASNSSDGSTTPIA